MVVDKVYVSKDGNTILLKIANCNNRCILFKTFQTVIVPYKSLEEEYDTITNDVESFINYHNEIINKFIYNSDKEIIDKYHINDYIVQYQI